MIFDVIMTDAEGGICSKEMAIAVDPPPPCIDWSQLLWASSSAAPDPVCILVTTPLNAAGDSFLVSTILSPTNFFVNSTSNATNVGTLTYNGPVCNGTIAGNMQKIGGGVGNNFQGRIVMTVTTLGVPTSTILLHQTLGVGTVLFATGPYSVPFTIPDTGGNISTIEFEVRVAQGNNVKNDYTLSIDGVITS